jgi:vacuolar protein sorting-associated protein 53
MQNFQIQTILKEAQNVANSDSKKLTENEICKTCSILCTSEYCLETIQQVCLLRAYLVNQLILILFKLEDKLREKVSKQNAEKISFSSEVDVFSG